MRNKGRIFGFVQAEGCDAVYVWRLTMKAHTGQARRAAVRPEELETAPFPVRKYIENIVVDDEEDGNILDTLHRSCAGK